MAAPLFQQRAFSAGNLNPKLWFPYDQVPDAIDAALSSVSNLGDTSLLAAIVQATGSKQPIVRSYGNKKVARFDATASQNLQAGFIAAAVLAQPTTHHLVFVNASSGSTAAVMVDGENGASTNFQSIFVPSITPPPNWGRPIVANANTQLNRAGVVELNVPVCITVEFNGVNGKIYANNVLQGAAGAVGAKGMSGLAHGISRTATSPFGGFICEHIVFSGVQSATDRTNVVNYLSDKWWL